MIKNDQKIFCAWLKLHIKVGKAITGKELASLIGVDPTTISSYIRYRTKPNPDIMEKILKVTNVSYDEMLKKGNEQLEIDIREKEEKNNMVEFNSKIEKEHYEIIKRFKDSETAKDFNDVLVRLEKLSPAKYYEFFGKIKGFVVETEREQQTKDDSEGARNGTEAE
jgi:transcriptional regulator with XRE-family HTH domain